MLYKRQETVLCLTAYIFFSSVRSCAKRNPAMPLPVADEGIAGLLQRSENRRSSVNPNDSPRTAKRVAEGEWSSSPVRGRVYVTIIAWYYSVLLVHKQCNTFWGCPFTLCILNTAGACDIVI